MSTEKNKTDITVVLPVYGLDETFPNAIDSVKNQLTQPEELIIVVGTKTEDIKTVKAYDYGDLNVRIIENDTDDTGFQNQMNIGVSEVNTKWFAFLEQDDEMSSIWLKNVVEYREVYSDVGMFLPLIVDFSSPTTEIVEGKEVEIPSGFVGMANEAVWASEFSDEIGILDNSSLLKYQNFNFDGMVMLKEIYEDFGGIKANVKLTFMYEFLLRMTYNTVKIMVIPKIGYKHINLRVGGVFDNYKSELDPDEARWWFATAKREYYHISDREIEYSK